MTEPRTRIVEALIGYYLIPIMLVTLEQVYRIINSNDGNRAARIATFLEIETTGYSYTASWGSYYIALVESHRSYLLLVSPPTATDARLETEAIALSALSTLLNKILDGTAVPLPQPVANDVLVVNGERHFQWLLLRVPGTHQNQVPTSLASIRHRLSPTQLARVELRLGTYLRALHGITNDCFGIPADKPIPEPLSLPSFNSLLSASQAGENSEGYEEDMTPYSWQDTFVLRLEELLDHVCGNTGAYKSAPFDSVNIDVDELRRSLSRAIGSFLFDDVEMPRLIWTTGNEEDVIVSLTPMEGEDGKSEQVAEADIAYILPTFGHAVWGDPLMEAWFLPPGPTTAVKEGYFADEEDGTLILFSRQRTKRVWYTVYLALMVLAEELLQREAEERMRTPGRDKVVQWAKKTLPECIQTLKDAPCY